eukprot:210724-Chlamydomonas_euryale.AAC.1
MGWRDVGTPEPAEPHQLPWPRDGAVHLEGKGRGRGRGGEGEGEGKGRKKEKEAGMPGAARPPLPLLWQGLETSKGRGG